MKPMTWMFLFLTLLLPLASSGSPNPDGEPGSVLTIEAGTGGSFAFSETFSALGLSLETDAYDISMQDVWVTGTIPTASWLSIRGGWGYTYGGQTLPTETSMGWINVRDDWSRHSLFISGRFHIPLK